MSARQLLAYWPSHIARAYRKFQIRRLIVQAERDLELTSRAIADGLELKRYLQHEIMNLKRELRSI